MERTPVIWTETAKTQLKEIYLYIAEDSIIQADRIFRKLIEAVEKLPEFPKKYPSDKYKVNNDGNYRAFELYHYRISYKITSSAIFILRIRSTFRNPEEF